MRSTRGELGGPGPNVFDDGGGSVRVDREGRLRLRLRRTNVGWVCAEVFSRRTFGAGTFRWTLSSDGRPLPRGVALGLFTWTTENVPNDREVDIEFFGEKTGEVVFSVQPADAPGNSRSFPVPVRSGGSVHALSRLRERVDFESSFSTAGPTRRWSIPVPQEGAVMARMNLWLRGGRPPAGDAPVEVVFERFEFEPESLGP